ncbi:DUF1493 family protein [Paraburkholderia metrosideri]|jgi:acyl carrier protein|uniref:DUF1493 family protein n=1 Tax=Paraburkholderia metrosideri TaxID=580937 RepID=A0ABN7IGS1_9BURK|nr:DUF1493 family protein [Paraburkholderia metrosideri]CAD6559694.1 hypothetical protein LMG28140_06685 [Paraburkholderia metrosideri]
MDDDTWERLEAFTREELGRPIFGGPIKLTPVSRLEKDLGVTGLDGIEFIDKWSDQFNVQINDFPYRRYFSAEGQLLFSSLIGLFSKRRRKPELMPLTLGMLADAMRLGKWDTEQLESASGR